MTVGGPLVRRFFGARGQGWALGADSTYFIHRGFKFGAPPHNKQNIREFASRRLGPKRHASTEVSALPRVAICIGFDF